MFLQKFTEQLQANCRVRKILKISGPVGNWLNDKPPNFESWFPYFILFNTPKVKWA